MFFTENCENFFKPLVGKHREIIVACLKAFYEYLYAPGAGGSAVYHITKQDLKNLFSLVIQELPMKISNALNNEEELLDDSNESADANYVISKLKDFGWLEEYMDKGTMLSAYRFSRTGKAFAQTFLDLENRSLETKQRNVRNTRSSLLAFLNKQDPYDLLDAARYAQRINEDIADDIAGLYERKRQLFQQTNDQRSALEDFLTYMERDFIPNISLRFSADSVERYRYDIMEMTEKIAQWPTAQSQRVNSRIQPLAPALMENAVDGDIINVLVNSIVSSLNSACNNTLPELRFALSSFTHRLDLIVRQASAMLTGIGAEMLGKAIQMLAGLPAAKQDQQLVELGRAMTPFNFFLINPGLLKLRNRAPKRKLITQIEMRQPTREELLAAALAHAEEQAFAVTMSEIKIALVQQMQADGTLRLSDWIIHDAPSLIALCHATEAASVSALEERPQFKLRIPKIMNEQANFSFLICDEFSLQQVEDE